MGIFDSGQSRSKTLRAFKYNPDDLAAIPKFVGDEVDPRIEELEDGTIFRIYPHLTSIRKPEDLSPHLVTDREPTPQQLQDLQTALYVDMRQRSNSLVVIKNGILVDTGTGQSSRIDAFEVAIDRNRRLIELVPEYTKTLGYNPRVDFDYSLEDASLATDAFCPEPDAPLAAYNAGIRAMLVIKGGLKYKEVVAKMKELGDVVYITLPAEERHFSHH